MKYRKHIKNIPKENVTIYIKYKCPNTEVKCTAILSEYDFDFVDDPCELCGSHGTKTVNFQCKSCSKNHEVELSSW